MPVDPKIYIEFFGLTSFSLGAQLLLLPREITSVVLLNWSVQHYPVSPRFLSADMRPVKERPVSTRPSRTVICLSDKLISHFIILSWTFTRERNVCSMPSKWSLEGKWKRKRTPVMTCLSDAFWVGFLARNQMRSLIIKHIRASLGWSENEQIIFLRLDD